MSSLDSRTGRVQFVPVDNKPPAELRQPGALCLILGVIWPAAVIAIELSGRLSAGAFFDPMPTLWHVLVVSFVPAMNLTAWMRLATASAYEIRWLMLGTGAAVSIATIYALLFLPLLPFAFVAIVIAGIGLLPIGPLAALIGSLSLYNVLLGSAKAPRVGRFGGAGIALGLAALIASDIPMAVTRLGVQWAATSDPVRRERGIHLLRNFGQDDLLLRLCYGMPTRPAGPLGMMLVAGDVGSFRNRPLDAPTNQATAREIYYRVHGIAFNQVPAPRGKGPEQAFLDDFQFDSDLGGAEVGGRIKGLSLTQSRIDGSISGDDAVAYLEWTFEFRNVSLLDREVRLELALPPGAVVSRASLWVNGEEKEAAYGGRGEVRAAYQKVAVLQRRDPLLVTTKGADRVLAQAFPVTRNGGVIKFKLGITAPLDNIDAKTGRLVLPAIFDRNFSIGGDVAHQIWIESRQPLLTSTATGENDSGRMAIEEPGDGVHRATGKVDDGALTRQRQAIFVSRTSDPGIRLARIGDGNTITQAIEAHPLTAATTIIVIDGSAQLAGKTGDILGALATIPAGTRIGLVIAGEPIAALPVMAWDNAALAKARQLLLRHHFAGGQDNAHALAQALLALEGEPHARLLWVHGPQPQALQNSTAELAQTVSRLARLPALTLYPVAAGPNVMLPDVPWSWSARILPHVGSLRSDLAGYLQHVEGEEEFTIERREFDPASPPAEALRGSDHIVRLWTRDRVLEMMRGAEAMPNGEAVRLAAVTLAAEARLVTPVSGAVVLESKQQYDENRLTPVTAMSVPTLPEPHEWALICIAGMTLLWLFGNRGAAAGWGRAVGRRSRAGAP